MNSSEKNFDILKLCHYFTLFYTIMVVIKKYNELLDKDIIWFIKNTELLSKTWEKIVNLN